MGAMGKQNEAVYSRERENKICESMKCKESSTNKTDESWPPEDREKKRERNSQRWMMLTVDC
jgi:hypothetical protein